jgi:hypothetical protein
LHKATLTEILQPFGTGTEARQEATAVLLRIHGDFVIVNDDELKGTRTRIAYFEDLLAQMRVTASPELFPSMASGYRAEIEKMQHDVLEYLTRHVSQTPPTQVA